MLGRFARLFREALIDRCACIRYTQLPASDSARHRNPGDRGQTMAEYALVLALVAVVAAVAFTALGPVIAALIQTTADAL